MSEPQEQERLSEQTAAARSRSLQLQRRVGDLAGRIAQTEDDVVRVHEQIADSGVVPAEQALEATSGAAPPGPAAPPRPSAGSRRRSSCAR